MPHAFPHDAALSDLLPSPRPPGCVPHMQYTHHALVNDPVKQFIRIPNEYSDVYSGPLAERSSALGIVRYLINNRVEMLFQLRRSDISELTLTAGSHLADIIQRPLGVLDIHAPRNDRNAASTSSWLATPLRSA